MNILFPSENTPHTVHTKRQSVPATLHKLQGDLRFTAQFFLSLINMFSVCNTTAEGFKLQIRYRKLEEKYTVVLFSLPEPRPRISCRSHSLSVHKGQKMKFTPRYPPFLHSSVTIQEKNSPVHLAGALWVLWLKHLGHLWGGEETSPSLSYSFFVAVFLTLRLSSSSGPSQTDSVTHQSIFGAWRRRLLPVRVTGVPPPRYQPGAGGPARPVPRSPPSRFLSSEVLESLRS